MMMILGILNFFLFLLLAMIHFSWAGGSTWGYDEALPRNEKGERLFSPRKIDSGVVGVGLLAFACYTLIQVGLIDIKLPGWLHTYGIFAMAGIFLLRAFGDFRYVGFFKRIKGTEFSKRDTQIYAPICLWLGLTSFVLGWFG